MLESWFGDRGSGSRRRLVGCSSDPFYVVPVRWNAIGNDVMAGEIWQ